MILPDLHFSLTVTPLHPPSTTNTSTDFSQSAISSSNMAEAESSYIDAWFLAAKAGRSDGIQLILLYFPLYHTSYTSTCTTPLTSPHLTSPHLTPSQHHSITASPHHPITPSLSPPHHPTTPRPHHPITPSLSPSITIHHQANK